MRLLLLLLIAAVAAYYTNPPREKFETEARAELQAQAEISRQAGQDPNHGFSFDDAIAWIHGMMAGQGSYENYYVGGKYTVDIPGQNYLECYGAFTVVKCQVKGER